MKCWQYFAAEWIKMKVGYDFNFACEAAFVGEMFTTNDETFVVSE